ncbi:MAG TPA: YlzJ-like family protein [Bacillota bacterium]
MTGPAGSGGGWDGVPLAVFWTVADPGLIAGAAAPDTLREATWRGRRLLLRRDGRGGERIERVLSTDPADYLDQRLSPGNPWPPDGGLIQ